MRIIVKKNENYLHFFFSKFTVFICDRNDRFCVQFSMPIVGADSIRPAGNCMDSHRMAANTILCTARAVNNRPYTHHR